MKKVRLPRKLVLIVAGIAMLSCTTAAFAIYVGRDALLGPPSTTINGVACTDVLEVKLRTGDQRWVRKFVKSDSTDGPTRLKTALRVVQAFAKQEQADLYQVVVLDVNGPEVRAAMQGRAIGAEILYAPNPAIVPGMDGAYKAGYRVGEPSAQGMFYGERREVSLADIEDALKVMKDDEDCSKREARVGRADAWA
ncbi:hypothetical protein IFT84_18135 [Rhizobium sp. CFBP 8762]|uniref:hypothetical protein n=1 Tax=Rhizobium sp. CFBP 8762 TaxID=2775279 RepID=UPI00177B8CDF|nr:hypothetical protein [Rhizobium sp. CFBP 8762]MBD8556432.1 hypothetical protein [Rhizobium sp. CFBP 8762]